MKIISLDNLKYVLSYLKNDFIAARTYADEFGNNIRSTYLRKGDKVATAQLADRAVTASSVNWNDVKGKPAIETMQRSAVTKKSLLKEDEYGNLPVGDISGMVPSISGTTLDISDTLKFHKTGDDGITRPGILTFDGTSFKSAIPFDVHVTGTVNNISWDGISGKPATFPPDAHNHDDVYIKKSDTNILTDMSNSLNVRKTLGSKDAPYIMQYQDFDKIGIYHIAYSDTEISCQGGNDLRLTSHEIYAFNTSGHDDTKTFSMIGTSPDLTAIFIGRFVDGVWGGWTEVVEQGQELRTKNIRISQESAGDGLSISKNDERLASVALGDPATKAWNVYNLDDKFYVSNNLASRAEGYALRIDDDAMHAAKKTVAEKGMEVKSSLTIPTSDDGTGNLWIS